MKMIFQRGLVLGLLLLTTACGGGGHKSSDLDQPSGPAGDSSDINVFGPGGGNPLPNDNGTTPNPATFYSKNCQKEFDCDNDGLVNDCDSDAYDATEFEVRAECDLDGDGFLETIAHTLATCSLYDVNRDRLLDVKTSVLDLKFEIANLHFCDNCPYVANPLQADADGDMRGNACDQKNCQDEDEDTFCDEEDNCASDYNPDQANLDDDALGDLCDIDDDGDGKNDSADTCPLYADPAQKDLDGDDIGDECDHDRDGDTILDLAIPNGYVIPGGKDQCPTVAPNSSNNPGGYAEFLYEIYWDGCGFDSDGDKIYDHEEAAGCLYLVNTLANIDYCLPP